MRIPKKISPDRIEDAIVELHMSYDLPFEIIFGVFFQKLAVSEKYDFIEDSSNHPDRIGLGRKYLFFNDKIKFKINSQAITLNCYEEYIGWSNYVTEIKKLISVLKSLEFEIKIHRMGIRYVSIYQEIDLRDAIKFSFTFGFPEVESINYSFSSEFKYNGNTILLNLRNLLPATVDDEIVNNSFIDIDVIRGQEELSIKEDEVILGTLNEMHQSENEIFFGLLEDDFLKTLNPIY